MPQFNPHQITEINEVIAAIEKVAKAKSEIGAHNKSSLNTLLKASGEKKTPTFFKCKREYADTVVNFFVKEKGLTKSKFHKLHQDTIFVLK